MSRRDDWGDDGGSDRSRQTDGSNALLWVLLAGGAAALVCVGLAGAGLLFAWRAAPVAPQHEPQDVASLAPPDPNDPAAGEVTLKGWTAEAAGANGWVVPRVGAWSIKDGAIVGRSPGDGLDHYLLAAGEYADFSLRADAQLGAGANAGIVVRGRDGELLPINAGGNNAVPGHPVVKLYETGVFKVYRSGTTHWLKDWESFVEPDVRRETPSGKWLAVELEARGDTLTVHIDKTKIATLTAAKVPGGGPTPGLGRAKGRVGLQVINGEVRFRNVQIRELPPT